MQDLPILLALLGVAWCAWTKPWVGVLGLVFVSVMHPQGYATGWLTGAPVYLVIGVVVALGVLKQSIVERRWPLLFWDWRFAVAGLLGVHMVLSTWLGMIPWFGWGILVSTAKMLPMLALVLLLIDDREKLWYLLLTIALSIAVVVLKGAYWAVMTGFENRVYGPPGSQYHDNNAFAVATVMGIPLLVLWIRQVKGSAIKGLLFCCIALAFAAALSSWSRGGLLCVLVVAVLLVLNSSRKWLALSLLLLGAAAFYLALPEAWLERMQTIMAPSEEGSAASRLDLWRIGWDYAVRHPWFGGGTAAWSHLTSPFGPGLAWHSSYVQMAADHGLIGLALWGTLLYGTMLHLACAGHVAKRRHMPWLRDHTAMLVAALAAYATGAAFLSIAFWELQYLLIAASIVACRIGRAGPSVPGPARGP